MESLILTSHFLNLKALEIELGADATEQRSLSPREVDALSLLATGCSRAEIAEWVDIAIADIPPILELDAKLEGALDRGEHFGLFDTQQIIEAHERGNRCLANADRPEEAASI